MDFIVLVEKTDETYQAICANDPCRASGNTPDEAVQRVAKLLQESHPGEQVVVRARMAERQEFTSEELGELQPGPIQHETLPDELLERIRWIYEVAYPHLGCETLEQWELGFMRDMNPEREVVCWEHIIRTWQAYHERYGDSEDKNITMGATIALSTGATPSSVLHERLMEVWKSV